jgi:hypothetical protein
MGPKGREQPITTNFFNEEMATVDCAVFFKEVFLSM